MIGIGNPCSHVLAWQNVSSYSMGEIQLLRDLQREFSMNPTSSASAAMNPTSSASPGTATCLRMGLFILAVLLAVALVSIL